MILGIDPGLEGGLSFTEHTNKATLFVMPIVDNAVDVVMFMNMLVEYKPQTCYIEPPQMRGGNSGLLTAAANYGRLLGILELREIPVCKAYPISWGNKIIPGIKGTANRKQTAIKQCLKNGIAIPHINANRVSDGAAEAYCISLYGLWKQSQQ